MRKTGSQRQMKATVATCIEVGLSLLSAHAIIFCQPLNDGIREKLKLTLLHGSASADRCTHS